MVLTRKISLYLFKEMSQAYGRLLISEHLVGPFIDNIYTYLTFFFFFLSSSIVGFLKSATNQSSKLKGKKSSSQQTERKGENYFLKLTQEFTKSIWKHLMGSGEREGSVIIRTPYKYSHITLGGLQSDFTCFFMSTPAQ